MPPKYRVSVALDKTSIERAHQISNFSKFVRDCLELRSQGQLNGGIYNGQTQSFDIMERDFMR